MATSYRIGQRRSIELGGKLRRRGEPVPGSAIALLKRAVLKRLLEVGDLELVQDGDVVSPAAAASTINVRAS